MRKVIAISVVLALIAGAAFAQTSISGTVDTRIKLASGDSTGGDVTIGGGGVADAYVQLSGQDPDGKFGGTARILANEAETGFHRAFIWWQPIPQVRIFLGQDLDGKFSTGDALTDWAFHRGGQGYINRHDWDFWRTVFPGNWASFGLAFSFYPVQGLAINLVVPTGEPGANYSLHAKGPDSARALRYQDVIGSLRVEAEYALPDIGKVLFSYIGPGADFSDKPTHYGHIGGSFLLTAVENFQAQIGVSTYIENDEKVHNAANEYYPFMIGLGASFAAGDWGVKFRAALSLFSYIGAQTTTNSWQYAVGNALQINRFTAGTLATFNIMPWYNFGVLAAYFDVGADIAKPKPTDAAVQTLFFFNPFIVKGIGPGTIRAGLRVESDSRPGNPDGALTTFSVPIQFAFSF